MRSRTQRGAAGLAPRISPDGSSRWAGKSRRCKTGPRGPAANSAKCGPTRAQHDALSHRRSHQKRLARLTVNREHGHAPASLGNQAQQVKSRGGHRLG